MSFNGITQCPDARITYESQLTLEPDAEAGRLSGAGTPCAYAYDNAELSRLDATDRVEVLLDATEENYDRIWEIVSDDMQVIQERLSEIPHNVAEDEFGVELSP